MRALREALVRCPLIPSSCWSPIEWQSRLHARAYSSTGTWWDGRHAYFRAWRTLDAGLGSKDIALHACVPAYILFFYLLVRECLLCVYVRDTRCLGQRVFSSPLFISLTELEILYKRFNRRASCYDLFLIEHTCFYLFRVKWIFAGKIMLFVIRKNCEFSWNELMHEYSCHPHSQNSIRQSSIFHRSCLYFTIIVTNRFLGVHSL